MHRLTDKKPLKVGHYVMDGVPVEHSTMLLLKLPKPSVDVKCPAKVALPLLVTMLMEKSFCLGNIILKGLKFFKVQGNLTMHTVTGVFNRLPPVEGLANH